jgi:hypothetical protein
MIVDGRTVLPQLAPMLRVLTLPAGSNQRAVMHCLRCNAEMTLMDVVRDVTMVVAGFEHHTFMCSSCHYVEWRLVFVRGEEPAPATQSIVGTQGCSGSVPPPPPVGLQDAHVIGVQDKPAFADQDTPVITLQKAPEPVVCVQDEPAFAFQDKRAIAHQDAPIVSV